MSAFDNKEKDDLEMELRWFVENHTIEELEEILEYVLPNYSILIKEQ